MNAVVCRTSCNSIKQSTLIQVRIVLEIDESLSPGRGGDQPQESDHRGDYKILEKKHQVRLTSHFLYSKTLWVSLSGQAPLSPNFDFNHSTQFLTHIDNRKVHKFENKENL